MWCVVKFSYMQKMLGALRSFLDSVRRSPILMVVILVVLVGIAALVGFLAQRLNRVEFVSSSSVSWYAREGTTLVQIASPAMDGVRGPNGEVVVAKLLLPPPASSAGASVAITPPQPVWQMFVEQPGSPDRNIGIGRPLGFLPDGSLLVLSPLGIARADVATGSQVQIVSAGDPPSNAPIGAASADLSLVAFQNQITHFVSAYRFSPATGRAVYAGSINAPVTSIAVSGNQVLATDQQGHLITYTLTATDLTPSAGAFFAPHK